MCGMAVVMVDVIVGVRGGISERMQGCLAGRVYMCSYFGDYGRV